MKKNDDESDECDVEVERDLGWSIKKKITIVLNMIKFIKDSNIQLYSQFRLFNQLFNNFIDFSST